MEKKQRSQNTEMYNFGGNAKIAISLILIILLINLCYCNFNYSNRCHKNHLKSPAKKSVKRKTTPYLTLLFSLQNALFSAIFSANNSCMKTKQKPHHLFATQILWAPKKFPVVKSTSRWRRKKCQTLNMDSNCRQTSI